MTLQLLVYLLLAWVTGIALTFVSRMPWDLEGRLAAAVPLGFATAALVTWLAAVPFGMSGLPVLIGAVLLVLILGACAKWADWRGALKAEAGGAVARWRSLESLPLLLIAGLAAFFFIPFWTHGLTILPDGLHAGHINISADWGLHLGYAGYLAHAQSLLPPENPWFVRTNLPYPWMPAFFSGQLEYLGIDLIASLPLISAILCLALVVVFFSTVLRFTRSYWASLIASLLFFGGSGLGFVVALQELHPSAPGPVAWLSKLGELLAAPRHDYSEMGDLNFQWHNPIIAFFISQRTFLFGLPLGLVAVALLWHWWRSGSRREILLAGITVGLLPLFHLSTYLVLVVFAGGLALLTFRRWREWILFFAPALILGLPQVQMMLPPPAYRFGWRLIQLGWRASTAGHHDNVIWFWFINTGLLIPLALVVYFYPRLAPPRLRSFALPAALLFLIPNVFLLQPWDWNNNKWFLWWAVFASTLAAIALTRLARRRLLLIAVVVPVLVIQVAAGFIDLDRAWQERLNVPNLRMIDSDGLRLASWVRDKTSRDSILLTGWQDASSPILALGERRVVLGYTVWLWNSDVDTHGRELEVLSMLRGGPDTGALLRRYGVNYVVLGPREVRIQGANVHYYRSNFPIAYRSPAGEYEVFKVS